MAVKLVSTDGCALGTTAQAALVRQLAAARRWWAELKRRDRITRLAQREEVTALYLTRIVRLALLSPAVTAVMLAGRQRAGVDVCRLTQGMALPASWREQERMLLLASAGD